MTITIGACQGYDDEKRRGVVMWDEHELRKLGDRR